MAGTRRGPEGSGRLLRTENASAERLRVYEQRLAAARTDSERVSAASQLLRAVMNDPNTPAPIRRQAGEQAIRFLTTLTTQVEAEIKKARGGKR